MTKTITLDLDNLHKIRDINPFLASYNVEFAEVTGGTFGRLTQTIRFLVKKRFMLNLQMMGLRLCIRI